MKRKPKLKQLWPLFALFGILILGISLRITLLETRDYWYDEAFTGVTVRQDFAEMNQIIVNDVHPPLYYWLLKGFTVLAGDGPTALRLFSVVFGVLTIILAFLAMRAWHKKSWTPAVLAAFVFAINPFLSNYSQEARMYTLLGFLILLAAILLQKARSSKNHLWWIGYGITAAAILYTHYLGFIFMVSFFLYDAWQQYKNHPGMKNLKKHLHWFAWAYSIPFVIGLTWIPSFLNQTSRQNSLGWVPNKLLHELPISLHIFLFGAPVGVAGVPPALGYRVDWLTVPTITFVLTLATTVLITYLTVKKKWSPITSFLGFMTAFPLIVTWLLQAVALQLYVERFLSGSAIFLILFFLSALMELPKKAYLYSAIGVYTVLVILIAPWNYQITFPRLSEYASQVIEKQEVVFSSPFDFTVARFYLGEDARNAIKLYNVNNPQEDLSGWAIISASDQLQTLPIETHSVITPQPQDFEGYTTIDTVHNFSILQK